MIHLVLHSALYTKVQGAGWGCRLIMSGTTIGYPTRNKNSREWDEKERKGNEMEK